MAAARATPLTTELTDPDGLILPSQFEYKSTDLGLDWAEEQRERAARTADRLDDAQRTTRGRWAELGNHYDAPERGQLLYAMNPIMARVEDEIGKLRDAHKKIGDYIDDMSALAPRIADLERRAEAFRAEALRGYEASEYDYTSGRVTLRDPATSHLLPRWVMIPTPEHPAEPGTFPVTVDWRVWSDAQEKNRALLVEARGLMEQVQDTIERLAKRLQRIQDGGMSGATT
jgi:hypothetical protein